MAPKGMIELSGRADAFGLSARARRWRGGEFQHHRADRFGKAPRIGSDALEAFQRHRCLVAPRGAGTGQCAQHVQFVEVGKRRIERLATVGALKPSKLVVAVVDNGVYLATGGQPTAASSTDFVQVALDCGWAAARDVPSDLAAVRAGLTWARSTSGPILLRIHVGAEQPKTDYFLEDPVILAREFEAWLR